MFPPETVQIWVGGANRSGGAPIVVKVTMVSPALNRVPETATTVEVGPVFGDNMTIGPPMTTRVAVLATAPDVSV